MRNIPSMTAARIAAQAGLAALAAASIATSTAAAGNVETVVVDGVHSDACLAVASAKQAQWSATPLMIHETKFFADDSTKVSETIFTINQAYAHYIGKAWHTAQFLVPERSFKSPALAAKAMRLAACAQERALDAGGTPAHLYTFRYLPDDDGTQSSGQIVIADATGLPLAQDLDINAAHPDPRLPTAISAVFTYGDAVTVPLDAEHAEYDRRSRTQQWVRDLQNGRGAIGP